MIRLGARIDVTPMGRLIQGLVDGTSEPSHHILRTIATSIASVTPVRTGALRDSFASDPEPDGTIGTDLRYANLIDSGRVRSTVILGTSSKTGKLLRRRGRAFIDRGYFKAKALLQREGLSLWVDRALTRGGAR